MADIVTNTLQIGGNNLILQDAEARQNIATNTQDISDLKDGLTAVESDVTDLKEDLDDVETALETKAEIDGYYEDMTVGDAEQLVSTVTNADDTSYNFRTTAGSVDVGDRAYVDAIVGGTVALNQLIQNGNFADGAFGWGGVGNWKSYEVVDGTLHLVSSANQVGYANVYRPIANGVKVNHVYVVSYYVKASKDSITGGSLGTLSGGGGISGQTSYTANAWFHRCGLSKPTSYADDQLYIRPKMTTDAEEVDVYLKNINCTDLTQMFGSTIADYIYGLEQSQAGAGVAWLKANASKIFNGEYIPFNAGTLQSVVGLSEKRNTGLNQWDEVAEVGTINLATGLPVASANQIRSKNYVKVLPNTTYFVCMKNATATNNQNGYFSCYDIDKNWLGWDGSPKHYMFRNGTFTTPSNCAYIRFYLNAEYGTTYNHDICINLHWDGEKDGIYEPYTLHTYAFDPTVELRGVPKLKDGKMYFDGDRYLPDGTVQRRYGVVDLGTLTWVTGADKFYTDTNVSPAYKNPGSSSISARNIVCSKYAYAGGAGTVTTNLKDKSLYYDWDNIGRFIIRDDSFTDSASFKAAMSGVMLVYELATPTTETATPYNPVEIVDDFGTEEFITTSPVPVGHETRYAPNLRAKLEMSPDSPDGDGLYIVQQSGGENTYIPLASSATIQSILARLTALEGNTNEG